MVINYNYLKALTFRNKSYIEMSRKIFANEMPIKSRDVKDLLMVEQVFLSPQVKQFLIISNKRVYGYTWVASRVA